MHAGDIDEESKVPIFHQVADSLRRRIGDGEWSATGFLPSVLDLGHDYSIGLATIRRAMGVLLTEGLLEQKKGQRARILPQPGERELVLLPLGAHIVVDAATAAERRELDLPRGAWMVRVSHRGVVRVWPADRVELRVPWNGPNHAE
ncbi:hypothetical protein Cme02nite_37830 [Catellatospora methionotrophica]|uniref:HTH gntR-type domain-containing protein n=1 Tax=Catellatospora methionotrophica TaxID=121620 RepID=A0A8J3PFA1_9ACTN|nr:GntR family transcriptional regulator [Catellatospora methionotrophica]GIG15451.1 hypothetical protein Cme02nite_37830 [Catellatospora methionotrophica]